MMNPFGKTLLLELLMSPVDAAGEKITTGVRSAVPSVACGTGIKRHNDISGAAFAQSGHPAKWRLPLSTKLGRLSVVAMFIHAWGFAAISYRQAPEIEIPPYSDPELIFRKSRYGVRDNIYLGVHYTERCHDH